MPAHRAFTLLELLVAAGITALLAAFIAYLIGNVAQTWSRASGRLGADAQARLVLDQLQLDLQGALFRDDGNVWMAINVLDTTTNSGLWDNTDALAARIKPAGSLSLDMPATRTELMTKGSLADARYGQAGVWLRFFTTSRGGNNNVATTSAPVAVGYQIIRRFTATNINNRNHAYLLHRAEARAAANGNRLGVLDYGFTITAPAYTTGTGTQNNDGSNLGDPRSIQVPGSNAGGATGTRNVDCIIADNVIDFGVRGYVRDANAPGGLRLVFPAANASGQITNSNTASLRAALPAGVPPTAQNFNRVFPDVIDVMIRILTDDGAALIANIERNQTPAPLPPQKYNGNLQQWWWGIATENSRVFTRRIVLNAKSL